MSDGPHPLQDELRQLHEYAQQFSQLIATAREAAPAGGDGHDSTGIARVEIDAEGAPTSLSLTGPWSPRLAPESLGSALLEAYQTAVQSHLTQWGDDLRRQGWQYDVREFDEKVPATPPSEAPQFPVPTAAGKPRGIESLLDDLIGELDFAHDLARQPQAPPMSSAAPTSRVSVAMQGDQLARVHIDAEWAEGKDAAVINAELAAALQTARLDQPPAPTRLPHADRLDDLLGEVMGFMSQQRSEM